MLKVYYIIVLLIFLWIRSFNFSNWKQPATILRINKVDLQKERKVLVSLQRKWQSLGIILLVLCLCAVNVQGKNDKHSKQLPSH